MRVGREGATAEWKERESAIVLFANALESAAIFGPP